jgi:hypothetical protein
MANAKWAFTYKEHARGASRAERSKVVRADEPGGRVTQAELLYRIFCGEDERLQELAVSYLCDRNDI